MTPAGETSPFGLTGFGVLPARPQDVPPGALSSECATTANCRRTGTAWMSRRGGRSRDRRSGRWLRRRRDPFGRGRLENPQTAPYAYVHRALRDEPEPRGLATPFVESAPSQHPRGPTSARQARPASRARATHLCRRRARRPCSVAATATRPAGLRVRIPGEVGARLPRAKATALTGISDPDETCCVINTLCKMCVHTT